MLSGPFGAGKTTVARELVSRLQGPVSRIEGDIFWTFIANSGRHNRRENFGVIMRAMTAAAIPFARSGFTVLLDFSIPPFFLDTARKILKEVPLDYVVLRPSITVCIGRATERAEGKIADYEAHREFHALFDDAAAYTIADDEAEPAEMAEQICTGLKAGRFRVAVD